MLLNTLRKDMMLAKKEHNELKGSLISTLVGEAVMIGKNNGNRESTDEEVVATIRKFIKNIDETINILKAEEKPFDKPAAEKAILESYMPKQMTDDELAAVIDAMIAALPEKNPKMMGKIMNDLKAKHNGLYDGKKASELVKAKLV